MISESVSAGVSGIFGSLKIMRKPKLVWESAAAPLTAAILSPSALNKKAHGISFVRSDTQLL
ncbi:hypothetical protein Gorai_011767, partial [Gossypium raimondii]|nr:hypothetical protein [Gossypium raimondii]